MSARAKRIAVAHAALDWAARAIQEPVLEVDTKSIFAAGEAELLVAESSAVSRMRALETRGSQLRPRGGFWANLMRASEALQMPDDHARHRHAYSRTLAAFGATR